MKPHAPSTLAPAVIIIAGCMVSSAGCRLSARQEVDAGQDARDDGGAVDSGVVDAGDNESNLDAGLDAGGQDAGIHEGLADAGTTCLDSSGGPRPVDVLFVIDNSRGMELKQEKVVQKLGAFLTPLRASGLDYHVGVTTTDPSTGGELRVYDGPAVEGCSACRFVTPSVSCPALPATVAGLTPAERAAVLVDACPAWLVLAKLASAGTTGNSFQRAFESVSRALGVDDIDASTGLPTGVVPSVNQGFRRPGAPLHLVFVSDENEGDKNDGIDVHYYERLFEGLNGPGAGALVTASAIVGWTYDADAPELDKVCSVLSTTFDQDPTNDSAGAAVLVDRLARFHDGCNEQFGDPADPASFAEIGSRFIDLSCRQHGVIGNLCDSDLAPALAAIANVVVNLCVPGPCISNANCPVDFLCNERALSCVAGTTCVHDAECPLGTICEEDACVQRCHTPGDCPRGGPCIDGACGAGCGDTFLCGFGQRCLIDTGQCTADTRGPFCLGCSGGLASADCGEPGNYCLTDTVSGGEFCGVDCSRGEVCPSGYRCEEVSYPPPSSPSCSLPETCVQGANGAGECSQTAAACSADAECPEGPPWGDCRHLVGRAGSCADTPGLDCTGDVDCPSGSCIQVECRAAGGTTACSCTRDADCPADECLDADLSDVELPVPGHCGLSGRPCHESSDCQARCVAGACVRGANCVPSPGLTCSGH